ncbi:MAG: prenyltransferase/squalene oxidase repeat-containing protein [Candidatus Nanopelagicales bacterium]
MTSAGETGPAAFGDAEAGLAALVALDEHLRRIDYTGPDPYDGLGGKWSTKVPRGRPKQAVVQLIKRSPVDVRRPLGVPQHRMTKTLSLAVLGLSEASWLPDAKERAERLADDILAGRNDDGGWGYEFDVQTRWGFYPAGSSNAIATAFAVEALHAVRRPIPVSVRAWIERDLVHPEGFLRYTAGSNTLVHNANVLAARALHRAGGRDEQVIRAVQQTINAQRSDGLWEYGTSPGLEWIDSFHTVYTLWGLSDLEDLDSAISNAMDAGTQAWSRHCFGDDGGPFYYADHGGSVDVHTAAWALLGAQGVCGRVDPAGPVHSQRSRARLLPMQRPHGGFGAAGEPAYPRWSSAHAFYALAHWAARSGAAV